MIFHNFLWWRVAQDMCVWIFSKETRMLFDITSVTQTRLPAMFHNLLWVLWRIDICWNNTCTLSVPGVLTIMVLLETCFIWEFVFNKMWDWTFARPWWNDSFVYHIWETDSVSDTKNLNSMPLLEMRTCKSNENETCYIPAFESCRVLLFVGCKNSTLSAFALLNIMMQTKGWRRRLRLFQQFTMNYAYLHTADLIDECIYALQDSW